MGDGDRFALIYEVEAAPSSKALPRVISLDVGGWAARTQVASHSE